MPMPACHVIKIDPCYFEQVLNGNKTFVIQKDDRGYQKGDIVTLREFNRAIGRIDSQRYTKRAVTAEIGFVTAYKQQPGYVVFSLMNVEPYSGT